MFEDESECELHELACAFEHYECHVRLWDDCGEVELDFTKSPYSIRAIWFDGQAATAEILENWFTLCGSRADTPDFNGAGLYVYDTYVENWVEVDAMIKHYQALKNIMYK